MIVCFELWLIAGLRKRFLAWMSRWRISSPGLVARDCKSCRASAGICHIPSKALSNVKSQMSNVKGRRSNDQGRWTFDIGPLTLDIVMFQNVRRFLEMIRFSHTLFALPFALLSAVLAWHGKEQGFSWLELLGILLCMVFARSAAMAFNRLADRHLDAANPRTAGRHLPTGQLTPTAVWAFTLVCAAAFLGSTARFLWAEPPNPWPLRLAVPVLFFVGAYSYTKRFTSLAHFWLGASLLLAPLAAWIAVRGLGDLAPPLVLGLA